MKRLNDDLKETGLFAVIFGGKGYEHEISCRTAGNIITAAREAGYSVLPIAVSKEGDFFVFNGDSYCVATGECFHMTEHLTPTFPIKLGGESGFFINGEIIPVFSALIAMHGDYGEDGRVQGLFDCVGIPYTGANTVSGALAYDKAAAKALAESVGVPTVPWLLLTERNAEVAQKRADEIGYPMFIKPSGLGSSVGASRVATRAEFLAAYRSAYELGGGRVLAERCIDDKRELECAYINASGVSLLTAPGMIAVEGEFYDYAAKYENGKARIRAVADVPAKIAALVVEYSERICAAFSLRHIARVDYFLTGSGELYFNEINTFPGMTELSLYPAMLEEHGIDRESWVSALIEAPLREVR